MQRFPYSAGYSFPYLYDEMQEVAKAYRAQCTPEFMVFDKKLELQYHGQFDSARPSRDVSVTGLSFYTSAVLRKQGHLGGQPFPSCCVGFIIGSNGAAELRRWLLYLVLLRSSAMKGVGLRWHARGVSQWSCSSSRAVLCGAIMCDGCLTQDKQDCKLARPLHKRCTCAGEDLRAALDDILAGKPVGKPIKPSVGCNIKWHP